MLRKHKDGGVILSSWPEGPAPRAPGSPAPARSGEQCPACGLRASLASVPAAFGAAPGVGSRTRRDKGAVAAAAPPVPLLAAPPLPSSPPPPPPRRSRSGSGVGAGPAWPAELLFCMTQWFLEKALLGSPEQGLGLERGMGGGMGGD